MQCELKELLQLTFTKKPGGTWTYDAIHQCYNIDINEYDDGFTGSPIVTMLPDPVIFTGFTIDCAAICQLLLIILS